MSERATQDRAARFVDTYWQRHTAKNVRTPKREEKTFSEFERHEAIRDTWGHAPRSRWARQQSLFDGALDTDW